MILFFSLEILLKLEGFYGTWSIAQDQPERGPAGNNNALSQCFFRITRAFSWWLCEFSVPKSDHWCKNRDKARFDDLALVSTSCLPDNVELHGLSDFFTSGIFWLEHGSCQFNVRCSLLAVV